MTSQSIIQERDEIRSWLDDNVVVVDDADFGFTPPGYEGPITVYQAPEAEVEAKMERLAMLDDLLCLRETIYPQMTACGGFEVLCNGTQADFDAYERYCNGEF